MEIIFIAIGIYVLAVLSGSGQSSVVGGQLQSARSTPSRTTEGPPATRLDTSVISPGGSDLQLGLPNLLGEPTLYPLDRPGHERVIATDSGGNPVTSGGYTWLPGPDGRLQPSYIPPLESGRGGHPGLMP